MEPKWISSTDFERDGTSQQGRSLAALATDYVTVDERTAADFVEFVRGYGKTLRYFNAANEEEGDFGAFIGDLAAKDVADFLTNPDSPEHDGRQALFRPHFTLFAVFLKLLQHAQGNLNGFTRRHLDYHFRRFLQMQPRPAVPDRLNLVFSLAEREARALVPKGTLVSAGVDALGKDRLYQTTTNLIVNRAQIQKVSSIFVDRYIVDIAQSWHAYRNDGLNGRFEMLRIAYGRPLPGDPLRPYGTTALDTATALDAWLGLVQSQLKFSRNTLKLNLSRQTENEYTLRDLIALKDTLPSCGDPVVDADRAQRRAMRFNGIVQKNAFNPDALAIPGFAAPMSLDAYWKNVLLPLEAYFAMPVESIEPLLDKILVENEKWDDGYGNDSAFVADLLNAAHHDKWRAERRQTLKTLRESSSADFAYSAILQQALFDDVDTANGAASIPEFEDALRTYLTAEDAKKLHDAAVALQWDTVLDLLAHAMTLRIGKAPPRKILWRDLVPAEDARSVRSTRSKVDADGHQPFLTFGGPQPGSAASAGGVLGFAVSSPILELSGGTRKITVTLGLQAKGFDFDELKKRLAENPNGSPLAIEVSTAKGWLRIDPFKVSLTLGEYDKLRTGASNWNHDATAPGLRLGFVLDDGAPPLAPLPNPPDGMDPRYPALRLLMVPMTSSLVTYYRELSSLFVGAVHLAVSVAGLLPTAIENDESILDPKKPFEPFGSLPAVGSRLSFGHPEVVTKKLDRLRLSYQWLDVPADLAAHYKNYDITQPFKSALDWFESAGTTKIADKLSLFGNPTSDPTTLLVENGLSMPTDHAFVTKTSFSGRVKTWRRYVQWKLEAPHFQHREYPAKAAEKALKLSLDLANTSTDMTKLDVTTYQVKPPYTPKLAHLKLDYDSSVEIRLAAADAGDRLDRTYHVHPFGVAELGTPTASEVLPLLPRYDAESALCIGLSGMALPETVTILFRLDEGSGDRDIEAPVVQWSQLSGNQWIPLANRVLADETLGLQRTGVVVLALDKAEPNTMLPAAYTWVRASITQDHASICDIRALQTQAVLATFADRGNAPEHYRAPLRAKTVAALTSPIAGIVGLVQPDPSFGGRPAEDGPTFSTRVSERLRHKQRALSTWDYERIVLDAFPQIFKAKCIPMPENEPGRVDVLVIPDVRALPTNELGPKAPIAMLSEIEAFLRARVPEPAQVNVRNARFRAVRVRLGVRFTEVGNDSYWMGRLNDELNRFLSPWAYDEGADIALGGRMYASSIVNFVDRCDYVDYIAGVSLFYTDDEGERFTFIRPPVLGEEGSSGSVVNQEGYYVEAGGADRVLVAYPQHRIDLITTEHYDSRLYRGISYMEVDMDFVVG